MSDRALCGAMFFRKTAVAIALGQRKRNLSSAIMARAAVTMVRLKRSARPLDSWLYGGVERWTMPKVLSFALRSFTIYSPPQLVVNLWMFALCCTFTKLMKSNMVCAALDLFLRKRT